MQVAHTHIHISFLRYFETIRRKRVNIASFEQKKYTFFYSFDKKSAETKISCNLFIIYNFVNFTR